MLQAAKEETVIQQRMALLKPRGSAAAAARPRADVVLKVKASSGYVQVCCAAVLIFSISPTIYAPAVLCLMSHAAVPKSPCVLAGDCQWPFR